jgi:ABC-type transport system substrate-binding protein
MRLSILALCLAAAAPVFGGSSNTNNNIRRSLAGDDCEPYEIDFVLVEGDSVRTSVESEIVDMLAEVGITVNTRALTKDEFNAAEQAGDFHLSFSETWGAPYDPHAYSKGWIAGDEGHNQALSGLEAPHDKDSIYSAIEAVLKEESSTERSKQWEAIHGMVHDSATMLPLWGARIPTVLNSNRLTKFQPGNQQFDYPVHKLDVLEGPSTVTIAPGGQTGMFSSVGRLDPHTYRPNEFFANNWVYEGLVSYGSYGQILPALASKWSVADVGDGQEYTFQLRQNVTFHDGAAWNCAAAKLNFDHVLAGPLTGPDWHGWYGLMDQISSWECNSDFEFVVSTKNKYYPFLQELSFIRPLRMLSPTAFAGDADPFTSNSCHVGWGEIEDPSGGPTVVCAGITAIAGTGPFAFESRTQEDLGDDTVVDNEVVFSANPTYWDGAPSFSSLVIKRYEDSDSVKAALLDGSLDLVWGSGVLPADYLIALDEDESNDLAVYHSDDIQNVIILLNSGKAPLDDINVRKTVIHAINKKKIIDDNLGGLFKPVDNVFPRDAPYCDVDITPRWDYDLEKAQFLNCAGALESGNNGAALGLGLGLGVTALFLLAVSCVYVNKSKALETELESLKVKEGAVNA